MEGAKGTKNAGASAAKAVSKAAAPTTKPSDASAKMEETEDGEEEVLAETEYDFTEDVDALVAGEELSEEFRAKAATIFEAAVTAKVNAEVAALQEAFESTLTEEVEKIQTELAEKVDDYLTYAAEQWMKENALQIEHGIKTEMAESFFNGLKGLFLEHNFTVPGENSTCLMAWLKKLMKWKLNSTSKSMLMLL